MKDGYRRFLVITIVILSAFLITTVVRSSLGSYGVLDFLKNSGPDFRTTAPKEVTLKSQPALRTKDVSILNQLNNEYTKITAAVMPTVVSINTAGHENKRVRDRFGRIRTTTERTMGQGSGVIVSKEGHIITNYHVVAGMEKIDVRLANGLMYAATPVGTDSALDIAVLKLESKGPFDALSFGDSDQVREGNIVLAFGNPFGIGKSVTQGVISAKERSISDMQGGLIQSSAAINPGYSGGPLVNIYGEIIGINSSIFTNDDKNPGFQGISFSIPSNIVKRTFFDIVERGRPIRGFLGVSFSPLVSARKSQLGYTRDFGALISDVGPRTPAAKAGLQPNDIIISYDKHAIRDPDQLIGYIQRSEIGKPVNVTLWRNKAEIKTQITPEEFNKDLATIPASRIGEPEQILRSMGVAVTYLSTHHRRAGITGVRVTRVLEQSMAEGLIKPNDIIYQVNQYRINQPNEFYDIIEMNAAKHKTDIYLIRNGQVHSKPIEIPKLILQ
ncbi:trypsin-like peptidase domain-containing protein [Rubritalea tangerina]|uniref:Trypsin-like peptidase domain-containing protein n=1 Tax=Rubritalea tangerina TaxID=430798 RepID=A0ABW4ZFA5_9BACT